MKFVSIFLVFIFLGCGTAKKNKVSKDIKERKAILGDTEQETDQYEIKDIRVEKNLMILTTSYSGGCDGVSADLVGKEFIMKSMPPKRSVKLILKKEGNCRELNEKQFVFNIEDLAYKKEKGSEIILLIEGYDTPIKYIFP